MSPLRAPLRLVVFLACVSGCGAKSSSQPSSTPELSPQQAAVVQTVDDLFAAMRERNCEAMRAAVEPGARIYRIGADGALAVVTDEQFVEGVCKGDAVIDERRIGSATVQVDAQLADAWVPYDVRIDGQLHHAGVDAVHLRRGPDGVWRVLAISYTVDR